MKYTKKNIYFLLIFVISCSQSFYISENMTVNDRGSANQFAYEMNNQYDQNTYKNSEKNNSEGVNNENGVSDVSDVSIEEKTDNENIASDDESKFKVIIEKVKEASELLDRLEEIINR